MAITENPKPGANLMRHSTELRLPPPQKTSAILSGRELQPNRGVPLNLDWVENVRVNTSAVERRAQTLVTAVIEAWFKGMKASICPTPRRICEA